jgi:hypothetical protein
MGKTSRGTDAQQLSSELVICDLREEHNVLVGRVAKPLAHGLVPPWMADLAQHAGVEQ